MSGRCRSPGSSSVPPPAGAPWRLTTPRNAAPPPPPPAPPPPAAPGPPPATSDPVPADIAGPPRNDFQVAARRLVADAPVRQRDPQLSEDDLVIVAVSPQGTDLGWQVIKDPSFVRAETPTASGELQHQTLRRPAASFIVTLPDRGAGIAELRLMKPRWTGTAFVLDPLGTIIVPAAR